MIYQSCFWSGSNCNLGHKHWLDVVAAFCKHLYDVTVAVVQHRLHYKRFVCSAKCHSAHTLIVGDCIGVRNFKAHRPRIPSRNDLTCSPQM